MTLLFHILVIFIIINDINASSCTSIESNTCNILHTKQKSNPIICDTSLPNCNITCLDSCSNKTIITQTHVNVNLKIQTIDNSNMIIYAPTNGLLTISTTNHEASFHSNTIYSNKATNNVFLNCIAPFKCKDNKLLPSRNVNRHLLSNAHELIDQDNNITTMKTSETTKDENTATVQSIVISKEIVIIFIGVVVIFICCSCIALISLSALCMYAKRERSLIKMHNVLNKATNQLTPPQTMRSVGSQSPDSVISMGSPHSHSYPSQKSIPVHKQIKFTNMSTIQKKFSTNTPQIKSKRSTITSNNNTLAPPTVIELKLNNLQSDSESKDVYMSNVENSMEGNNTSIMPSKTDIIDLETETRKKHQVTDKVSDDIIHSGPGNDDTDFTITVNKLAFDCQQINFNNVSAEYKSSDDTDCGNISDDFMVDYVNAPISHCRDHKGSIYNLSEAHNNGNVVQQILEAQVAI